MSFNNVFCLLNETMMHVKQIKKKNCMTVKTNYIKIKIRNLIKNYEIYILNCKEQKMCGLSVSLFSYNLKCETLVARVLL